MSDQDMATMPIPELVAGIREKAMDMQPLMALTLGTLAGRIMNEYERAEKLQGQADRYQEVLGNAIRIRSALEQRIDDFEHQIDNCEYQRCPCRK